MDSPRSLGYRLPAEWEPHEAVWLSWPVNPATWPTHWDVIQDKFAEIALTLSKYQSVYINLANEFQGSVEKRLNKVALEMDWARGDIQFFNHPVNDVWVRDHGPIYITRPEDGSVALTDWSFNGWGEKYPFDLDDQIPALIAEQFGLRLFKESMVLEGGSLETNGVGDLVVTRDCLLNPNRNPDLSRQDIGSRLRETLAVEKVHWLDGCIDGDDTDGHIDNLARFFKPDGVLVASVDDPEDPNFEMLSRLAGQCREVTLVNGKALEVRALPLPARRDRLPMSYTNFFIVNGAVLVPAYGQEAADAHARDILATAFPGREIVPIDCQEVILDGGALHCLTQQVPQTTA